MSVGSTARSSLKVLLGVALGLVVAELMFRARDHGAFPRLNVYEADDALGVRLRPGAEERVSFNGNPVSSVRINSQGFRGDEPPPPDGNEVVVVGDSQVFGLGVEESETFTRRLVSELPGRHIFNAGVPTYGPLEFLEVTRRLAEARHPTTVVYVVNMANDLFEAARPNKERHAVLDGWALRRESVPAAAMAFPGRDLLLRESHAVFAYRTWRHHEPGDPDVIDDSRVFASEGTWRDLLGQAASEESAKKDKRAAKSDLDRLLEEQVAKEVDRQNALDQAFADVHRAQVRSAQADYELTDAERQEYDRTHGNPGDVSVYDHIPAEAGPGYRVNSHLVRGAEVRAKVKAALELRAAALDAEEAQKLLVTAPKDRDAIQLRINALHDKLAAMLDNLSPLREPLRREAVLCKSQGAQLVVLVLPIDVQVSSEEWAKYGQHPRDMTSTEVLIDDVVKLGADLGIPVWSALPTLRAAEPGAFLRGDIHMTPKGHEAVSAGFGKFMHDTIARGTP